MSDGILFCSLASKTGNDANFATEADSVHKMSLISTATKNYQINFMRISLSEILCVS